MERFTGGFVMISQKLKERIEILRLQGEMRFVDRATEKEITQFEKENRVRLPEKYKEWLLFSDGGECFLPAGVQFYGVKHKPIIDVNDKDRPDEKYVVIGALAYGDPILFRKTKEQICVYNQAENRIEKDEVYEDFYTFLVDLPNLLGM